MLFFKLEMRLHYGPTCLVITYISKKNICMTKSPNAKISAQNLMHLNVLRKVRSKFGKLQIQASYCMLWKVVQQIVKSQTVVELSFFSTYANKADLIHLRIIFAFHMQRHIQCESLNIQYSTFFTPRKSLFPFDLQFFNYSVTSVIRSF